MKKEGIGCGIGLIGLILFLTTPFLISIFINNYRVNHVAQQLKYIDQGLEKREVNFRASKSSKEIGYSWGSANDCIYTASRTYLVDAKDLNVRTLKTEILGLELQTIKPTADGSFLNITVETYEDSLTFQLSDGPWEDIWTLLDYRC